MGELWTEGTVPCLLQTLSAEQPPDDPGPRRSQAGGCEALALPRRVSPGLRVRFN